MYSFNDLNSIGISEGTRVLSFFPHPDDETGFAAGFLTRCVSKGAFVKVVTVTRGDKGDSILKGIDRQKLAEIRTKESEKALGALGIKDFLIGDFPDGGLDTEDIYEKLMDFVSRQIQEFQPAFVLTLEPWGIYGHPDHVALSKAVTDTCRTLGVTLVYATISADKSKFFNKIRLKMAHEPEKIIPIEPNFIIKLSSKEFKAKIKAFESHKSQFRLSTRFFMKWFARGLLANEYFHVVK
jgi:LmbE family N-acetylglucosaminyl deacetylase